MIRSAATHPPGYFVFAGSQRSRTALAPTRYALFPTYELGTHERIDYRAVIDGIRHELSGHPIEEPAMAAFGVDSDRPYEELPTIDTLACTTLQLQDVPLLTEKTSGVIGSTVGIIDGHHRKAKNLIMAWLGFRNLLTHDSKPHALIQLFPIRNPQLVKVTSGCSGVVAPTIESIVEYSKSTNDFDAKTTRWLAATAPNQFAPIALTQPSLRFEPIVTRSDALDRLQNRLNNDEITALMSPQVRDDVRDRALVEHLMTRAGLGLDALTR